MNQNQYEAMMAELDRQSEQSNRDEALRALLAVETEYQSALLTSQQTPKPIGIINSARGESPPPQSFEMRMPVEQAPKNVTDHLPAIAPIAAKVVQTKSAALAVDSVVIERGCDVKSEKFEFLWKDWLPNGTIALLAGAPGQGKTTLAVSMAATVSRGGVWPDGTRCKQGNVLMWSGEDDHKKTLLPRFLASGGDPKNWYFIRGAMQDGKSRPFDPATDMELLEREIQEIGGVSLLIVDPIVSAVAGDGNSNSDVRRGLQPLVDLAARLNAAVLGISHFNKGASAADPALRVVGSIAFAAVSRIVLAAAKITKSDGEDCRVLMRAKSNIGPDEGGFEYHIGHAEAEPGIEASRIEWGQPIAGKARDLLAPPESVGAETGAGAKEAAKEFLTQLLAEGPFPRKTVEAEAKEAGISWATVRRASDELRVRKQKGANGWYWSLPNLLNQTAQDAQPKKHEQVEQHEQVDGQTADSAPKSVPAHDDDSEVF